MSHAPRRKVLAVSSGGGHWIELLRLVPAFEGHEVIFVAVDRALREHVPTYRCHVVNDATRWNKLALLLLVLRLAWIILRERPDCIVTTGAAPGYLALRIGKLLGARTAWIDSLANADVLSLSGQMAGKHADLWLTQWPHLAQPGGPRFEGAVL